MKLLPEKVGGENISIFFDSTDAIEAPYWHMALTQFYQLSSGGKQSINIHDLIIPRFTAGMQAAALSLTSFVCRRTRSGYQADRPARRCYCRIITIL